MERMQGRGEGQPRDTMKTASILGNRASIPQGNTVRIIPAEGEGAGVLHSPEALADGSWGGVGFLAFQACHTRTREQPQLRWGMGEEIALRHKAAA